MLAVAAAACAVGVPAATAGQIVWVQAAGNGAGARDAYRSCVKQARYANVTECYALAGK